MTSNNYQPKYATQHTMFTEDFKMGSDSVTLIIDAYEFADGHYFVTASLWNDTKRDWVVLGNKHFANYSEATDTYIKKYKLTY